MLDFDLAHDRSSGCCMYW